MMFEMSEQSSAGWNQVTAWETTMFAPSEAVVASFASEKLLVEQCVGVLPMRNTSFCI